MEDLQTKIARATEIFNKAVTAEGTPPIQEGAAPGQPAGVDLYNLMSRQRLADSKKPRAHGANPKLKVEIATVIENSGLARKFNLAKMDAEVLAANGDKARSRMVMDQYMNDSFMPAIEAIVHMNSADELLNSSDVDKLDEYVLTMGNAQKGFTKSLIASLYSEEMQTMATASDSVVTDAVRRIKALVADMQIRSAVGLANKTLQMVNTGQQSCSDDDYILLQKVAERGQ